jgi:hypothetical protein
MTTLEPSLSTTGSDLKVHWVTSKSRMTVDSKLAANDAFAMGHAQTTPEVPKKRLRQIETALV